MSSQLTADKQVLAHAAQSRQYDLKEEWSCVRHGQPMGDSLLAGLAAISSMSQKRHWPLALRRDPLVLLHDTYQANLILLPA